MNNYVEVVSLFYSPNNNYIEHEDGRIFYDISDLIPHKELEHLKRIGGTKYVESDDPGIMYEIVFPIPEDEDVLTFYYYKDINHICDCNGDVVFNIFAYITPQDLMLFKHHKEDVRIYGKHGQIVDLIYQE